MAQFTTIESGSFPEGAHIQGAEGPVPVAALSPGDLVQTHGGLIALVAVHEIPPAPGAILVRPGAFGPEHPSRDLVLAAEQLVYLRAPDAAQGALAPVGALVNGSTVLRANDSTERRWFTLQCAQHAIATVDGLPLALHRPAGAPLAAAAIPPGPALFALRGRVARGEIVAERADIPDPLASGAQTVMLRVDGRMIASESPDSFRFRVPPGASAIVLVSRSFRLRNSEDTRRFGVAVTALVLDGVPLDLAGPAIGPGFHLLEGEGDSRWRWTDGAATIAIPPSARPRRLAVAITDWHSKLEQAA
jgi:hypothetical protein